MEIIKVLENYRSNVITVKESDNEEEYWIHIQENHPEKSTQPNLGMINIMCNKWGYDIELKGILGKNYD